MWDNDFCHAVIDASLFWTGEDEANCPALKYLRTMAGYYLWENAGRPTNCQYIRPWFFEIIVSRILVRI